MTQKTLLLIALAGGLAAVVGGFAGIGVLLHVGGGTMLLALLLLPWLREPR